MGVRFLFNSTMKEDKHQIAIRLLAKAKLQEAERLKNPVKPKTKKVFKFKLDTTDYSNLHGKELAEALSNSLIKRATLAEKELYSLLDCLNVEYIKQHPIWIHHIFYIVDAFFPTQNIIVELDGKYHKSKEMIERDRIRTKHLNKAGYKVIRYDNEFVFNRIPFIDSLNRLAKLKLYASSFL